MRKNDDLMKIQNWIILVHEIENNWYFLPLFSTLFLSFNLIQFQNNSGFIPLKLFIITFCLKTFAYKSIHLHVVGKRVYQKS